MTIGKFSVNNPVLLNILFVLLLLLGFFSISRLPREQFSEVPFYWVNILQPYPGVSAEDMEREVTINIEKEMQGLDDLKQIQSITSEGLAIVRVEFNDGIDEDRFDKLFQEVRTRFNKVNIPEGALDESIEDFSSNDFLPLIEVALTGDMDFDELWDSARFLKDQIEGIPQVSGVELVGAGDREIYIDLEPSLMESRGISLDEISRALRQGSSSVPGGTLSTSNRDFLLRTQSPVEEIEDFRQIIVRRSRGAEEGIVYLQDLAEIREGFDPGDPRSRYNGQPSISLRISKIPKGNSLKIVERLNSGMDEWLQILPDDLEIHYLNDSTIGIKRSLKILTRNALFGLLLLVWILYSFVGLRNAILAAVGIPVSFAITFILLEISGETLNSNTLFGLVLVLGMIVDHSIVIIENSFRFRELGLDRREAAIRGVDQVWKPVIAASATTIAAFLPLMILPGTIGKFLRVIPFTVTIALVASTAEALIFLPVHYAEWPGKEKEKQETGFFLRFHGAYKKLLKKLYKRKGWTVIGTIALMVASCGVFPFLEQDLFSAEDYSLFYIDLEMPPGTSLESSDSMVGRYEEALLPMLESGDVTGISSYIGFQAGSSGNAAQSNVAQLVVDLREQDQGREKSIDDLIKEAQNLTKDIPGPWTVIFRKAQNGPPTSKPIGFRLFGDSYDELQELSRAIEEELTAYPEVYNIEDNFEEGTPEVRIRINQERASYYGLDIQSIGRYIRASVEGVTVSSFFRENQRYDVILSLRKKGEWSLSRLEQIHFLTPDGRSIPFSALCTLEDGSSPASIKRIDGKREITIEAEILDKERVPEINRAVEKLYQEEFRNRYPDLELSVGGEFSEFNDLLIQILRIFLIGIFLMYLILGTQFKSYTQPLLIMISVPLALMGVLFYLGLSGTAFSTTVLYAGVALAGIAVNDSIVLLSFINELREQGRPFVEAVQEAAFTRFRPIILTSVTTIAGLLPTALGLGGRSVVWAPMAGTIIFGLIFSTLTALIFLPSLYGVFYERK